MSFRDPEFPAQGSSINIPRHNNATWVRAKELTKDPDNPKLFGTIEADNIGQGELGDCWLLAVFACVADFPGHIMSLFSPNEYSEEGRYEVRMYDVNKGWQTIVIDDYIPARGWGSGFRTIFVEVPESGSIWTLLLEKAFAKFCGTYNHLDGGGGAWGYQVLTGITKQMVYFKEGSNWEQWVIDVKRQKADKNWRSKGMKGSVLTSACFHKYSNDEFFRFLAHCDQGDCMISASMSGEVMEGRRPNGLIENHAYSVLEVQKAHGKCMIKLRNPWGSDEWNGAFSDGSGDWDKHPDLAEDLRADSDKNDGAFWMRWEDFVREYDNVKISLGTVCVPKYSRTGGKKEDGIRCGLCKYTMSRVWCLSDMEVGKHGQWTRLQDGDFCFMCRRAQTGLHDFRPELARVPGLDVYAPEPAFQTPEPPRKQVVCMHGPGCYRHNPEHFASFSHPWLGQRKAGVGWSGSFGGGSPSGGGSKTPASGGKTPASGGKTPSSGGGASFGTLGGGGASATEGDVHDMLNAAKRAEFDIVEQKLKAFPKMVNRRPQVRDWALIHRLASLGDLGAVQKFVEEYGADPALRSGEGMTPAEVAEYNSHTEIAEYLRSKSGGDEGGGGVSADSPADDGVEDEARQMLRHAHRRRWHECMRIVAALPSTVNMKPDGEKYYAVHHGAYQGNVEALQRLVHAGADLSVTDDYGRTPLDTATSFKRANAAAFIRHMTPSDGVVHATRVERCIEGAGRTTAEEEAISGDIHAMQELTGFAALADAYTCARSQNWDAAFEALSQCPDLVNVRRPGQLWALIHHGAASGSTDAVTRLCEEFKADPTFLAADGLSAVEVAEQKGHEETAAYLRSRVEKLEARIRSRLKASKDISEERAAAEQHVAEVFRMVDKDNNGYISRVELAQVLQDVCTDLTPAQIEFIFNACDANRDAKIDFDEFLTWLFLGQ